MIISIDLMVGSRITSNAGFTYCIYVHTVCMIAAVRSEIDEIFCLHGHTCQASGACLKSQGGSKTAHFPNLFDHPEAPSAVKCLKPNICLVGGLEHFVCSIYREYESQLTNLFQRGSN